MKEHHSRFRRAVYSLVVVIIASVVVIVLVEMAYRVYVFGRDGLSLKKMNSVHPIGSSGLLERSRHREIVFELKPNVKTHFKLARFETNSQGLRDKEYRLDKPEGTFRVAVIGDSFTMPSGVEIEEAYHSVLEDRLNSLADGHSYEFINFGVGGYYLLQYYGVMVRKAAVFNPDMILIGFCAFNDHRVIPDRLLREPYKVMKETRPAFGSFAWETLRNRFFPKEKTGEDEIDTDPRKKAVNNYLYVKDLFKRMGDFSANSNIPIVIAYLATYPVQVEPIKSLAEERGLYFVDTSSALSGMKLSDVTIHRLDPHPNPRTHEIYANVIHDYLVAERLLPH